MAPLNYFEGKGGGELVGEGERAKVKKVGLYFLHSPLPLTNLKESM